MDPTTSNWVEADKKAETTLGLNFGSHETSDTTEVKGNQDSPTNNSNLECLDRTSAIHRMLDYGCSLQPNFDWIK
jgi:hypothetical protein